MKTITLILLTFMSTTLNSCSGKEKLEEINEVLSNEEKQDLVFLREEEKLARDVYLYAYNRYQEQIFYNISQSEVNHMARVLELLVIYNINDPVLNEIGQFSNPQLQNLYIQLTQQVDLSLTEALKVGAIIEDLDINDIDEMKSRTQNSDILNMYDILQCGSENHLRSFTYKLERFGLEYEPQYISIDDYNAILASENQRCGW